MGLTQVEFAKKIEVTEQTIVNWEGDKTTPNRSMYALIAQTFNANFDWLLTGEGGMFKDILWSYPTGGSNTTSPVNPGIDLSDFVLIPQYDVEAAAGGGVPLQDEIIKGLLAFRRQWIKTLPYSVNSLSLLTVRGDSMEPAFKDRDLVMVTKDIGSFYQGVYLIRDYIGLRVKRLDKDRQGNLHVISDNPLYKEEIYTDDDMAAGEIEIIGRVVWHARTI